MYSKKSRTCIEFEWTRASGWNTTIEETEIPKRRHQFLQLLEQWTEIHINEMNNTFK